MVGAVVNHAAIVFEQGLDFVHIRTTPGAIFFVVGLHVVSPTVACFFVVAFVGMLLVVIGELHDLTGIGMMLVVACAAVVVVLFGTMSVTVAVV